MLIHVINYPTITSFSTPRIDALIEKKILQVASQIEKQIYTNILRSSNLFIYYLLTVQCTVINV